MRKLHTDDQIRHLLDPVEPGLVRSACRRSFSYLQQQGVVESFRGFGNTLLVALDGAGCVQSESIQCERCMVSRH